MSGAYPPKPIPRVGNEEDTEGVSRHRISKSAFPLPQVISSLAVRADPRREVRETERWREERERQRPTSRNLTARKGVEKPEMELDLVTFSTHFLPRTQTFLPSSFSLCHSQLLPIFRASPSLFLLISLPLSASLSLSFSWLNASTSARWRTHDEADTRLDCSSRVKATLFPSLRNPSPSAREKSAGGRSELDGNEAASAAATRFRVGWGSLPDTTGSTKEKKRGKKEEKNASRSIADEASWRGTRAYPADIERFEQTSKSYELFTAFD